MAESHNKEVEDLGTDV